MTQQRPAKDPKKGSLNDFRKFLKHHRYNKDLIVIGRSWQRSTKDPCKLCKDPRGFGEGFTRISIEFLMEY